MQAAEDTINTFAEQMEQDEKLNALIKKQSASQRDRYRKVAWLEFEKLPDSNFAILNIRDENYEQCLQTGNGLGLKMM